ncbi:uncharacterized protein LOC124131459 [Haliotis rufescens]|uniref:uncharacterized protein LOC124131459 n=1 Tax=Haliotis rufescens TaxID=6454 RepID=UPI00201EFFB0|nr:uncharacterized protein LOC124131459 [Haliotis rufescens]
MKLPILICLLGFLVTTVAAEKTCNYNGQIYHTGEGFKSTDGCNTCGCTNGFVFCTEMACAHLPLDGFAVNIHQANTCGQHYISYTVTRTENTMKKVMIMLLVATISAVTLAVTVDDLTPDQCLYGGVVYNSGDSFKSTDGCNTCGCGGRNAVFCTLMACIPPNIDG